MANTAPAQGAPPLSESASTLTGGASTVPSTAQGLEAHVPGTVHPLPLDSTFSWSGYFTAIGTLFVLLALLWGLVWLLRRSGRFNFIPRPNGFPRDGLRIEAQLPLGPKKGLTVVRFLDKRLLLGITEQQITLLQEIEDTDDTSTTDFYSLMEESTQQDNKDA